ncbi:hypothetical protein PF005_g23219 [Phytophthora fragariae]|uniref:MULE transposase domain-containing protein n=1 Tax=Phytophthora fragariae TaxID=53985 RepID=A0A6A4C6M1_9STRA|nr:hypothetical protein PF009_g24301 [Phytophthora fragariae]KAE9079547.1 hypothetical protein PF007_g23400 [Phytophthora fragariae]KAE9180576.1 hypothetical protein PF005_g23219 [Phytophthora fragariae]KAE9184126.1 hypothetical protein PF002_g26522 [Phytophthora fragariae]KAE9283570.1 hypothetical protein PF001_g22786 [Phytophthora fragariae]
MEHEGYSFYRQRIVEETGTTYYICSRYRVGCKARLIARDNAVRARNDHSCDEAVEATQEAPAITDVRVEMRTALQEASLANLSLPPSLIWVRVMHSFREAYPRATLNTIPRLPSISIVKYTRTQATGSDAFRAIESVPTRNVAEDDTRPFLQFSVVHTVGCGQHRYLGFGHPDLVRLLRYSSSALYIDGTFKMVPRPFTQCLIVMIKDPGVDVYVPAMYVLLDSKQQEVYWNALNYVIIQIGRLLEPATVTCDFERGLMNAVTDQFPLVKIVGCLFHWKQTLRRKMIELRISQPQIAAALALNVLDIPTIIHVDQIADKGIRFVRSRIVETGANTNMVASGVDLQNRTNNPLESYNRTFGDRFSVKHPSLLSFVETAKE